MALMYRTISFTRRDQASLYAFYTHYSWQDSKNCLPMYQKKSFTKTPLQACQAHLPITALHTALSHLPLARSALYTHTSAYTKRQYEHATVRTSTTIQEWGQRCKPSPSQRRNNKWQKTRVRVSTDHTAICFESPSSRKWYEFVGIDWKVGKEKAIFLPMPLRKWKKERVWLVMSLLSSQTLRVNPVTHACSINRHLTSNAAAGGGSPLYILLSAPLCLLTSVKP